MSHKHLTSGHFRRAIFSVLTVIIALLIATLSLLPLEDLPKVRGSDKTHHLIAYVALACCWTLAVADTRRQLLKILSLATSFGILIELLQPYTNRHFDYLDIVVNFLGVSIGLLAGYALGQLLARLS